MKPKLSEQACDAIANEYSRLRSEENVQSDVARTQPVTARTLETLIRLSTAHARARMAKTVSVDDAQAAIELVQYAYFKKVLEKEKGQKRRRDGGGASSDEESQEGTQRSPTRRSKRTRTDTTQDSGAPYDTDEEIETPQPDAGDLTRRDTRRSVTHRKPASETQTSGGSSLTVVESVTPASISGDRLHIFKNSLQKLFREAREQSLSLNRITSAINENNDEAFTSGEIEAAVLQMTEDNQIMVADGIVFLI